MQYVTTRSNQQIYPARQALMEERAPDGGFFVPVKFPQLDDAKIQALARRNFNQCVADILNLLFETRLTSYDIDFATGRCPVRLVSLPHRIWLGETFHNLEGEFERMVKNLYCRVSGQEDTQPTSWFRIGLRIGVLFGFFGKLMRKESAGVRNPMDVAVISGDFSAVMAAWYARKMGLPIANIVLACNENNNAWELLHHGALRANLTLLATETPEADYLVPPQMERFVHGCGGSREVARFLFSQDEGRMYVPGDSVFEAMKQGMQPAVVGQPRLLSAVPNVYRTHDQLLHLTTALAYCGLMDYRSTAGESRPVLILSEKNPEPSRKYLAEAQGESQ